MQGGGGVMAELRRGWHAPATTQFTSGALMLPLSALVSFMLVGAGVTNSMPLILLTGPLQLLGTFWIAGRLSRK